MHITYADNNPIQPNPTTNSVKTNLIDWLKNSWKFRIGLASMMNSLKISFWFMLNDMNGIGFPIWYRSIIIAPDSNDASLHNSVHNTSNSTHLTSSRHVFDTRMQERNQEQRKKAWKWPGTHCPCTKKKCAWGGGKNRGNSWGDNCQQKVSG